MSIAAEPSPNGRLVLAIGVSLVVNAIVWSAASTLVNRRVHAASPRLTFERVVIDKKTGVRRIKLPKPKPIEKPKAKPPPVQRQKPAAPPPPPSHNLVVTAKPKPGGPPAAFQAPSGGSAQLGQPTVQGPATVAPPTNPAQAPVETPKPAPPAPVETPKPAPPAPVETPKPAPPPAPTPPPPPKPSGPTKDAEPASTVEPEIPDNLKSEDLRAFVHVKVAVHPDGSFDVVLRTSSHNEEVDKLVLDALKRWKWKPALEDGQPVESTKLFKFEFEVK